MLKICSMWKAIVWYWNHGADCTVCKEFAPGKMKRGGICLYCVEEDS